MASQSLDDALYAYAVSIAPTAAEISWCKREADQLVRVLSAESDSIGLQRVRVAGGLGKQTCLRGHLDVDLILYLDAEPPYRKPLRRVQNVVLDHYRWRQGGPHSTQPDASRTLHFTLEQRIDVHVYLARNFIKHEERKMDPCAQDSRQYSRALQWLRQFVNDPYKLQLCSAAIAPACTDFMHQHVQDRVTACLVRLCKKWDKSVCGLPWIRGRSGTLELLAVAALHLDRGHKTLLASFRRFLRNWFDIAAGSFCRRFAYADQHDLFRSRDIPACIRDDKPLLIDPVDPFNNKLRPFVDANVLPAFRACAAVTLNRLDVAEQKGTFSLDRVFAPQDAAVHNIDRFLLV